MTQLATVNGAVPVAVTLPAEIERALIGGDLDKLSPEQRLSYYQARCRAAQLSPITRPFEYIRLNGKLVLYATKSCTDSLAGLHGLSHRIISRETIGDVHEVMVEASSPTGRRTEDIGAVVTGRLQGEALANARMKAVTKAKRRATLSFCGLGDVIDETELDTVKNVERCDGDGNPVSHHAANFTGNESGHGSGAYASPETVKAYSARIKAFVAKVNARWADRIQDKTTGEIPDGAKVEIVSTWQISGHLLKWAKANGLIEAPDEPRGTQREKFIALAWDRHRSEIEAEAGRYGAEKIEEAYASLIAEVAQPEDESQEAPREDDRE